MSYHWDTHKGCTRCGIVKPVGEFVKNPKLRSGYGGHCRQCERARVQQWRAENPGRDSSRRRAYREAHIERERERVQEWHAENPGRVWAHSYRTRAAQYGYEPVLVPFTREELIDVYGDACYHCGDEWTDLDHWPVAVVEGGEHRLENVVPSCAPCNSAGAVELGKRRRQAA